MLKARCVLRFFCGSSLPGGYLNEVILVVFLDNRRFHCPDQTLSLPFQPAGAALVSTPRASELPPAWVWGMPPSWSGPHSDLPREVPPEKQRAIHVVPLPRPSSQRSGAGASPAFPPLGTGSQPAQAGPVVGGPAPAPDQSLDAKERTRAHVPCLLDADVEGQSRDCTVPLCRMGSRAGPPSLYQLEKEFLS